MGIACYKVDFQLFLKLSVNWFFDKGNINFAIEQQYGNISYFCNAKTLIKRATAGLVQPHPLGGHYFLQKK